MVEQASPDPVEQLTDSASESAQPNEQYKSLQRELDKARKRNKELTMQLLASQEAAERLNRVEDTIAGFMEVAGKVGFVDGENEEVDKFVKGVRASKPEMDKAMAARRRVAAVLADNDTDLEDPRLKSARQAWDSAKSSGDLETAAAQFESALKQQSQGGPDPSSAQAIAAKQAELKEKAKVDMGESSGVKPKTLDQLRKVDIHKLSRTDQEAHRVALLAAMARGR